MHPVEELIALAGLAVGVGGELAVADVVDDRITRHVGEGLSLVDVAALPADDYA